MIVRIPLPEYRPDQSVHSGVLVTAENVFPAADGYKPVNDITAITDALASDFLGGTSAIAADGTAYLLAGTASHLYKLTAAGAWSSLLDSLSVTDRWRFAQFGQYVICVNGSTTQQVDLSAGTAAALSGAPTFTSIAVVGDYLVGGQPDSDINKVRWSAFADQTGWTNGTDQAGEQPMRTGGAVQYVAGGEYGIILQRQRITRMTRTGDATAPFQFDAVSENVGCADGATVAQLGRTIYFYSDGGFMSLTDGQDLQRIGAQKVDATFARMISRDNLNQIYTAIDPVNNLVFWGVPGRPGTMWIYEPDLARWSTASFNFSAIFPGFTTSVSTDDLDGLGYTDLDSMTISLDDPRWSGGNPRLYLIDEDGKAGTLAGDTLAADIELGYQELIQGRRARVRNVRPVTDATGGLTVKLNCKARMGDADNIKTGTTLRSSGIMPVRGAGRYIKARLQVAAATTWNYVQGLEIECEPGGER